jgi:hypothetical protein
MSQNLLLLAQSNIKSIAAGMRVISAQASYIQKAYFATPAASIVSLLSADEAPATQASALTKSSVIEGVTLSESIVNFFNNSAVTMSDNTQRAMLLTNGSAVLASPLSQDLEAIGNAMKQLGTDVLTTKNRCLSLQKLYFGTYVSAVVGALSSSDVLPGCEITKEEIISAITLTEQFINLMSNQAVVRADYAATLAKLERLG